MDFIRSLSLLSILLFCTIFASAQWARNADKTSLAISYSVEVDGNGNSYITGYYGDSLKLGGTLYTTADFDGDNMILAKYANNGTLQWASTAPGQDNDQGKDLAVTSSGDFYVTGYFIDSIQLGNQWLTSSSNNKQAFVAKYNSNGTLQWADKNDSESGGMAKGGSIALDQNGNVYVGGKYENTIIFGNDTLTPDSGQIFMTKYNSTGTVQWASATGVDARPSSTGEAIYFQDMSTNINGLCYVTGHFEGSYFFGADSFHSVIEQDPFIAHFNSSGQFQWASRGKADSVTANSGQVETDDNGNAYWSGFFGLNITFEGNTMSTSNIFGTEYFLVKYDQSGNLQWNQRVENCCLPGGAYYPLIVTNGNGTTYFASNTVSGYTMDFGNGVTFTTDKQSDIIVEYNSSGQAQWVREFDVFASSNIMTGLALHGTTEIFVTGHFPETITYSFGKINANSRTDGMYVTKLNNPPESVTGQKNPGAEQFGMQVRRTSSGYKVHVNTASHHKEKTLRMYDLTGQRIYQTDIQQRTHINMTPYARGMYFIELKTPEQKTVQKIVW